MGVAQGVALLEGDETASNPKAMPNAVAMSR
jgi:hypothetical protein